MRMRELIIELVANIGRQSRRYHSLASITNDRVSLILAMTSGQTVFRPDVISAVLA